MDTPSQRSRGTSKSTSQSSRLINPLYSPRSFPDSGLSPSIRLTPATTEESMDGRPKRTHLPIKEHRPIPSEQKQGNETIKTHRRLGRFVTPDNFGLSSGPFPICGDREPSISVPLLPHTRYIVHGGNGVGCNARSVVGGRRYVRQRKRLSVGCEVWEFASLQMVSISRLPLGL